MLYKDFLKKKRIEAGYSQAELAKKLGVKPSYISALERGCDLPSAKTFVRICIILNIRQKYAERIFHGTVRKIYQDRIDAVKSGGNSGAQLLSFSS